MSQIPELANAVLFFAPGFLLIHVLHVGGIGRGWSGFERVLWSVVVAVFIRWSAMRLVEQVDLGIESGLDLEIALLGLAVAVGVILSLLRRIYVMEEEQAPED
jgi:hypothetical protein